MIDYGKLAVAIAAGSEANIGDIARARQVSEGRIKDIIKEVARWSRHPRSGLTWEDWDVAEAAGAIRNGVWLKAVNRSLEPAGLDAYEVNEHVDLLQDAIQRNSPLPKMLYRTPPADKTPNPNAEKRYRYSATITLELVASVNARSLKDAQRKAEGRVEGRLRSLSSGYSVARLDGGVEVTPVVEE